MWNTGPTNSLADIEGVTVGHAQHAAAKTGVTVVGFDQQARASVSIIGQAPGTREAALLDPSRTVERIDGLVLSGGSAFGLAAADGVMAAYAAHGRGFRVGAANVPIVPAAILFDLNNGGEKPTELGALYRQMGAEAVDCLKDHQLVGAVGAGAGATTGHGPGGLGTASCRFDQAAPQDLQGHCVAALVAVNAVGNPYFGDGPHLRAAPFEQNGEFGGLGLPEGVTGQNANLHMKTMSQPGQNTTIGAVVTSVPLTKSACHSLAISGQDGIAQAIYPAHTALDGDLVFGISTGDETPLGDPASLALLQAATTATMARAIGRAMHAVTPLQDPA